MSGITRRRFIKSGTAVAAGLAAGRWSPIRGAASTTPAPLKMFGYGDVDLHSEPHETQLNQHLQLLMGLDENGLLKPIRRMSGRSAPGPELGGWYSYDPKDYDIDGAYAPSCTFGQWVSSLARMYAIKGTPAIREKILRLNRLYAQAMDAKYFDVNRFPAYCFDKLALGLLESRQLAGDPAALRILEHTTDAALPSLPGRAVDQGVHWRAGRDASFESDESYTNSENLFIAYQLGAGERYRKLAVDYLAEGFYGPLSEGRNDFAGRHAYSHVNSLSSAMQAYLTLGSERHLRAAKNGFAFLAQQSFATGGWGPNETLQGPGSSALFDSLNDSHRSFETPCGSYAHFKLTRYLLRVTGESAYGDSMERVMYNTVLGAMPIRPDGETFYYADFNNRGRKGYSAHRWPCCSGTLPQVAADYRINCYFHDPLGLYVNLYIPSTVVWNQGANRVTLSQSGDYPFDGHIQFQIDADRSQEFALHLRIPAWADGASIAVNGRRWTGPVAPGGFAALMRTWSAGDRVDLELPLKNRLEPIDAAHSDTVALLAGPLVLFAVAAETSQLTRAQLLSARKTGARSWEAVGARGATKFLPFTSIKDEQYATYLKVT